MENQTPVVTPQVIVEPPKQSNFLVILLSVLLLLSVSIAGFFAYQTQKLVKELTILKTESIPTPEVTMEPTTEPVVSENYIKGEILVTFNEGSILKQAKDIFEKYGITTWTQDYWKASNFVPDDSTILKNIDIFKLKIPSGTEDEYIKRISSEKIVRAVLKNFVLNTTTN